MAFVANSIRFLAQKEAQQIDIDLMNHLGFSIDQLMELAGLSVACAIHKTYPPQTNPSVLVVAGPGNNGGDGLVAARHMQHFGYNPQIFYPKRSSKSIFQNLVLQCDQLRIPFLETLPSSENISKSFSIIVDGVFGFSFSGDIRSPFDTILPTLKQSSVPIVSIDVPSGWDVEKGNLHGEGLEPDMLISLTAPKQCAHFFQGKHHFLGGRFVPPSISEKYQLNLPSYPGAEQCVEIHSFIQIE